MEAGDYRAATKARPQNALAAQRVSCELWIADSQAN